MKNQFHLPCTVLLLLAHGLVSHGATIAVTSTADSGLGTLRRAIEDANADATPDTIEFNLPGTGVQTIAPLTALPAIRQPVTIDGYTQPGSASNALTLGGNAVLLVELSGMNAAGANGLTLTTGSDQSTVRGLAINRFSTGIYVEDSQNCVFEGNFIGIDAAGTSARPNDHGIIVGGWGHRIGGVNPGSRNVISGNSPGRGIWLASSSSNEVAGNYVGLAADGTTPLPNLIGLYAGGTSTANQIGGTNAAARNVFSANSTGCADQGVGGNRFQGNFIGTDASGTLNRGNTSAGIDLGSPGNLIGGTNTGAGNLISGRNGTGIYVNGSGNVIAGNLIGTDGSGMLGLGNDYDGILIQGGADNLVGGVVPEARNVIAANRYGIYLYGSATVSNRVQGNFLGTDITGASALGNAAGVTLFGAPGTVIGGDTAAAGNVISGNTASGLYILETTATNTVVQGNYIGTDASGATALPNAQGFYINSSGNLIGGTGSGAGNLISANTGIGVAVDGAGATNNIILGNRIFGNGALGIDLAGNGPNANDADDTDNGPNHYQNFPEIASAARAAGEMAVRFRVDSAVTNAAYPLTIELFVADSAASGEGRTLIHRRTYDTPQVFTNITFTPPVAVIEGDPLVATATDANGNTSEFSPVATVIANHPPVLLVTNLANSGPGTLREVILAAEAGSIIQFAVTGVITLFDPLDLDKPLSVTGPGATNLIIRGSGGTRLFTVSAGPAEISGLTLSNGVDWFEAPSGGGAIRNSAHLTLNACFIVANGSTFSGGAVLNSGASAVFIANGCAFALNNMTSFSGEGGGAIWNNGTLRLTNCTFAKNYSFDAGAILNRGDAIIASCTIAGNAASRFGGEGGGILSADGTLTLQNSIVAGNVANDISPGGGDISGTITGGDYNLIQDTNKLVVPGTHNVLDVDPQISPIRNLGGPTPTCGLAGTSPALDAADGSNSPATDQRGVARPQGVGHDIGAFEGTLPLNHAPVVANPIPDLHVAYGDEINFAIPSNTFADEDEGQALILSLIITNETACCFNLPLTIPIGGQAYFRGRVSVTVSATDDGAPQLSASTTFDIVVPLLPLTVTADNKSRREGDPNPPLTGTLIGVEPGDNITATFTTTATSDSPPGTYPITPVFNDPDGKLAQYAVTTNAGNLTVVDCLLLKINNATLPNAARGVAYGTTFTAASGTAPYTFAVTSGALPGNMSLAAGGLLSGTPANSGSFSFTVTAADSFGCTISSNYSMNVVCPLITLAPAMLFNVVRDTPYNTPMSASGGQAPYTFAVTTGTLPPGMSLSSAGLVSGTPTNLGDSSFTITATDAGGCTGSRGYSIGVVCPTLTLSPSALPAGIKGSAYNAALSTASSFAPHSYTITSGALPGGLTLSSSGMISGTPTNAGNFPFTSQSTEAGGCTGIRSYTLTVEAPVYEGFAYTAGTPLNGRNGGTGFSNAWSGTTSFLVTPAAIPAPDPASGGNLMAGDGKITRRLQEPLGTPGTTRYLSIFIPFVISGFGVPERFGILLNGTSGTGLFVGKPGAGVSTWALENEAGGSRVTGPTIGFGGRIVVKCEFLAGNDRFTFYVNPTPGQPEPASGTVKFNSDAGTITNIAFTAANTFGQVWFDELRLSSTYVGALPSCPVITVDPSSLPNGTASRAYDQTLDASGGTAPYAFAVTGGALPDGLVLSSAGLLSGTPVSGGSFSFTVTATDAGGCTGNRGYAMAIRTLAPIILINPTKFADGSHRFSFTNTPGATFTTLAATNLSLPLSNWTVLGPVTEVSPGQFQFTDLQATNHSQRIYRVRSP